MWQPTSVFLPGKFHGQRSLAGYSPKGHNESDTTEQLSAHALSHWASDCAGRCRGGLPLNHEGNWGLLTPNPKSFPPSMPPPHFCSQRTQALKSDRRGLEGDSNTLLLFCVSTVLWFAGWGNCRWRTCPFGGRCMLRGQWHREAQ